MSDTRRAAASARPTVRGKFLFAGDEKLYVRGVTYGPFHPDAEGCLYGDAERAGRDFAQMAQSGVNAIRTYTVPPAWLLDAARDHGLWVMVGLPWEQHLTFLDDAKVARSIEQRVRSAVRSCGRHPAILCFTIGNEIPSSIVRWHGRAAIERFLRRLYDVVKKEDPTALATYVNFPPTEYLQLDFVDFLSFNVYLEKQDRLEAYLGRLQSLAGDKPVLMAEVGLDSRRNGESQQAAVLDWQVRSVFAMGCAGVFVFAWTDEWSRGGFEIDDWDFGLTTRSRRAKPALDAMAAAFRDVPFARDQDWPSISVVICSYNGQRTIRQTLQEVSTLDYPNFEAILVNDGSTDDTPRIAAEYPTIRLITVPNGGLSAARNIGMHEATGEIVAYIDDDAYPDPHWLHYLAMAYRRTTHAAMGGPNIPPPGDGPIAECVANAPGGPIHVLLTDDLAEHIPGCNFSARRAALIEAGGFDPVFRVAGDDVDACWRIQQRGTVGYAPAAVVWHHRRNSVKAYWRQQKGYGKAEALLERKWPRKYNAAGHLTWLGRLYGTGVLRAVGGESRVYQGTWGSGFFQSLYQPSPGLIQSFAQMPEWYVIVLALLALSLLGFAWTPLFLFLPVALAALALPLAQAVAAARRAEFPSTRLGGKKRGWLVALTTVLFVVQPAARLWGRVTHGLTPFRRQPDVRRAASRRHVTTLWSETWRMPEDWMHAVESRALLTSRVRRGGDYDAWDLDVQAGIAGSARVRLAVEEHGAGKQLLRWGIAPRFSRLLLGLTLLFVGLAALAALSQAVVASVLLLVVGVVSAMWTWRDAGASVGAVLGAIQRVEQQR